MRSLPSVACFPHLLDKPRAWVVYVVVAQPGIAAAKKTFTVLKPPDLDPTTLRFAVAHLRPLFGSPVYADFPVTAPGDASLFVNLVSACCGGSAGAAASLDLSKATQTLRAVSEDLLRLSRGVPGLDVHLLTTRSPAVTEFRK